MINLEPRNLIKFGNSSYVISIPKEWVERNKLKKGDSVFIEQNGNEELIIVPQVKEYKEPNKEIVIDVKNKEISLIKRELISAYINNYKLIKIRGDKIRKKKKEIKKILQNLTAVEIIEENDKEIIIKDFLNMQDVSIESLLRKIDNVVRSMFYDLSKNNEIDTIVNRDENVNKLVFLIIRTLKHSFDSPATLKSLNFGEHKKFVTLWDITIILEKIADELKRIARRFGKLKCDGKIIRDLNTICNEVEKFYSDTMKTYYNEDRDLALSLSSEKKLISARCNILSEKYWKIKGVTEILENFKDIIASVHNIGRKIYTN